MPPEEESTPPINSFGAARATARELAAINRAIESVERQLADVHRALAVELLLLAFMIGGLFFLAYVVGTRLHG